MVTGVDATGVAAAAAALTEDELEDHFAIAVDEGRSVPLPGRGGRVIYERRASPLHAARAGVAATWCVVLGLVGLSLEQPLVLAVLLACALAAALAAGRGAAGRRCRSPGACRSRS